MKKSELRQIIKEEIQFILEKYEAFDADFNEVYKIIYYEPSSDVSPVSAYNSIMGQEFVIGKLNDAKSYAKFKLKQMSNRSWNEDRFASISVVKKWQEKEKIQGN